MPVQVLFCTTLSLCRLTQKETISRQSPRRPLAAPSVGVVCSFCCLQAQPTSSDKRIHQNHRDLAKLHAYDTYALEGAGQATLHSTGPCWANHLFQHCELPLCQPHALVPSNALKGFTKFRTLVETASGRCRGRHCWGRERRNEWGQSAPWHLNRMSRKRRTAALRDRSCWAVARTGKDPVIQKTCCRARWLTSLAWFHRGGKRNTIGMWMLLCKFIFTSEIRSLILMSHGSDCPCGRGSRHGLQVCGKSRHLEKPRSRFLRMGAHSFFGAFCLDVRTLAFCQVMGFPLNQLELNF